VLTANKQIDSMVKWGKTGVVCKLDIMKAYDHMNCDL